MHDWASRVEIPEGMERGRMDPRQRRPRPWTKGAHRQGVTIQGRHPAPGRTVNPPSGFSVETRPKHVNSFERLSRIFPLGRPGSGLRLHEESPKFFRWRGKEAGRQRYRHRQVGPGFERRILRRDPAVNGYFYSARLSGAPNCVAPERPSRRRRERDFTCHP